MNYINSVFFAPYGLFPDVEYYLALQKQAGKELLEENIFMI